MEILISAFAIFLASFMIDGIEVKNFWHALLAAVVLAVANFLITPLLNLIFLPVNILTLGLFSLVINALILMLVSRLVSGLTIRSFGAAFFFGILISILNLVLSWIF